MIKAFLSASDARQYGTKNIKVIHSEIRHIESKILDAVDNGELSVRICDSPFGVGNKYICNPMDYWKVWREQKEDRIIDLHISNVKRYFEGLGYGTFIQTNQTTGMTICWQIEW